MMKKISIAAAFLSCFAAAAGAVETPTGVYFDEITTNSITASAYAATPAFTGLETGLAGVNVAKGGVYSAWRNGNVWATKAAMPTARAYSGAASVGGKIYVIGGERGSTYYSTNEEYDPVGNTWATKAPMPTARSTLAAGVIDGKIYAVGGNTTAAKNANEAYDPISNSWTTKAAMPTARCTLGAGVVGGKLYAVGGDNGTRVKTNEEYDPVSNSWATRAAMSVARSHIGVAVVGDRLYVLAGHNGSVSLNTNEEYNPGSNSWTSKASVPTARYGLAAGGIGGKIYAVGGHEFAGQTGVNEEYDPATNTWETRAAMPTGREGVGFAISAGKGYLIGGNPQVPGEISTNESYDPGVAFVIAGLNPNTSYAFKAKARDAAGVETAESPVVSTYTLALPPAATASTFTAVAQYSIDVNWSSNGNPGGTLYRAQVSPSSSFATVVTSETYNLSATLSGLAAGTTYYARVAAINGSGAITAFLPVGSTVTVGVPAAAVTPTGIYFDEISSRSIVASAYAPTPAFAGLEVGAAGINVARDGSYAGWRGGNVWAAKAAMPTGTASLSGGAIGGKLYAVGGYNGSSILTVNREYDPAANTWTTKAPLPTSRRYSAAGAVRGKLYVIGGTDGATVYKTNEEYDPAGNSWTTKAIMPTARNSLAAGVMGGKIYAVGGHNGTTSVAANEEYDPESDSWTTRAAMPTARYSFGAGVVSGKLYAAGGVTGNSASIVNINEEYSPALNTWTTKAPMPTTRYALSGGVVGGKLYMVGGYDSLGGGGTNQAVNEEYDPLANAWATKAAMPTARREFLAGVIGGKLYAAGGWGASSLSVNEVYDSGVAVEFAGLTPNTQYVFKAKARDSAGVETGEGPAVSTYTLAAIPAAASPVFSAVTGTSLTAAWLANGNPSGTLYRAQLSAVAAFTVIAASSDTYNLSAVFSGLSAGATYYARVSAVNRANIESGYAALGSTRIAGVAGNTPPLLLWTGESGYAADGLNPQAGASTTTFTYRVMYLDIDNDAPAAGYPKLHIKKGGIEIAGSPFNMTYVSGAYNAGAIYTHSRVLAVTGTDYTYYFEAQDSNGAAATGTPLTAVDAPDVGDVLSAPQQGGYKTVLGNNLFSPRSGSSAKIKFSLTEAGSVSIKIYDLSGRLMRTLFEGSAAAGDTQKDWDGKDDSGLYVVPGIYFLHYKYPGGTEVRKIGVKK